MSQRRSETFPHLTRPLGTLEDDIRQYVFTKSNSTNYQTLIFENHNFEICRRQLQGFCCSTFEFLGETLDVLGETLDVLGETLDVLGETLDVLGETLDSIKTYGDLSDLWWVGGRDL